jgi:hypothetical protein
VKHVSNGSSHLLNRSSHTGALRGNRDSTAAQRIELVNKVQAQSTRVSISHANLLI